MKIKSIFKKTCEKKANRHKHNECHIISLNKSGEDHFTNHFVGIVPSHYDDETIFAQRLKSLGYKKASDILKKKLPTSKMSRSGDLGEVLAHEFIATELAAELPIKKLRWKDSRNMALRGDDVIGFKFGKGRIPNRVFKCESKSRENLNTTVVSTIGDALNKFSGKPDTHSLIFIADRLRESGESAKALQIETMLSDGYKRDIVQQVAFTFSGNDPTELHQNAMKNYRGLISRIFVGIHAVRHQSLIKKIYENVFGKKK